MILVMAGDRPNKTKNNVRILERFCKDPTEEIHGFKLVEDLGIKSGNVYPFLIKWESRGWFESRWEESDRPGPRRRLYRLTAFGAKAAQEFLEEAGAKPHSHRDRLRGFPSTAPELA